MRIIKAILKWTLFTCGALFIGIMAIGFIVAIQKAEQHPPVVEAQQSASVTPMPASRGAASAPSAAAAAAAAPGLAMPDYDVEAHCRQVATAVGGSEEIRHGCLAQEQAAYNALKPRWDALPPTMRSHCDQVARAVGQSFEILGGCVDQETQATKANQQFKFQR